jgi:SAM-dependent methyltransferase
VSRDVSTGKYDAKAETWTDEAYADPSGYLAHRADLVAGLGMPLVPGDAVLDLACGDAGLAAPLTARGLRYRGVDLSQAMVDAARRRLGERIDVTVGDLNTYEPPEPVACTTCFRAIYYAADRPAFFRRVAAFTTKKLVFDLNPRQYRPADIVAELQAAGLCQVTLHPFFAPQRVGLPNAMASLVRRLEGSGPIARLVLRVRFSYLVAARR